MYCNVNEQIKHVLQAEFRDRISFDPAECLLYSRDLGSPPPLIRPLISRSPAEGVVQPQNEDEVIYLLEIANRHRIPLTPRGSGTSGYGGTIPRYGGLVVDFTRMNNILDIDSGNLTVTTGPGAVWADVEREIAKHGLALRLYPGSAPSSTVAGWLAEGGSGFGSYAYGWFGENVVSTRVALPDGSIIDCKAEELDAVKDVEGITGFITEITFRVRPLEKMKTLTASFETIDRLAAMLNQVAEQRLKLWSASFINPYMAKLKDGLRLPGERFPPEIAGAYLATFVFPAGETSIRTTLDELIVSHHGRRLAQGLSARLWQERFDIPKIRQSAPSPIPTKVIIPLISLKNALENSFQIRPPLAVEGLILQDKDKSAQAVLLGFILHDERKLSYNLVYGLSLSFIRLAQKYGGKPCAEGIYFRHLAARIFGASRLERLIRRKKSIDPLNIMNPGKVIARDGLYLLMKLAWNFEPVIRFIANLC